MCKMARPIISYFEFEKLLFSFLAIKGRNIIDKDDLVVKTFKFSKKPEMLEIFEDIEYKENIDGIVSSSITDGINNLQTFGLVGKFNPTYEKLIIYLTKEEAQNILDSYLNENIKNKIEIISQDF